MILTVVFVVLMMFWLFGGVYVNRTDLGPPFLSNTIIPWLCVAILGWQVFGGGHGPAIR